MTWRLLVPFSVPEHVTFEEFTAWWESLPRDMRPTQKDVDERFGR